MQAAKAVPKSSDSVLASTVCPFHAKFIWSRHPKFRLLFAGVSVFRQGEFCAGHDWRAILFWRHDQIAQNGRANRSSQRANSVWVL